MNIEKTQTLPGHLIRRCHQISVSLFLDECEAFDITPIQFAVLSALKSRPDIGQIKLAGLAALDRSTTGYVVDRLDARGLVRRKSCKADKRVKQVSLSKSGEALLGDIEASVLRVGDRFMAPLNSRERVQFIGFLKRLVEDNNALSRAPLVVDERLSA